MRKIILCLLIISVPFSAQGLTEKEAERILDAVVEVRITVPENAQTARRFGTNRVASGVIIDQDGHVLTIGFQTIEAETVKIVGRLFVRSIRPGGPFEKAGIKSGDIILAVNNQAIKGMADFYRKAWALGEAGVDVPLTILQGIEIRQIVVQSSPQTLYRQPEQNRSKSSI